MAPASYHSRTWRVPSWAWPWFPIWVATLARSAASISWRTSQMVVARGFWMRVGFPSESDIMPAAVCVWSGVEITTASMFPASSRSMVRKSRYRFARGKALQEPDACRSSTSQRA